jgi:hypothetical protein
VREIGSGVRANFRVFQRTSQRSLGPFLACRSDLTEPHDGVHRSLSLHYFAQLKRSSSVHACQFQPCIAHRAPSRLGRARISLSP